MHYNLHYMNSAEYILNRVRCVHKSYSLWVVGSNQKGESWWVEKNSSSSIFRYLKQGSSRNNIVVMV